METKRQVLVFGDTQILRRLAAALRGSPILEVVEGSICDTITPLVEFSPDVILVDGAQITPEQFHELLDSAPSSRSILISIDPLTYQLTVLSAPTCPQPLERTAQVVEILSAILSQPT